MPYTPGSGCLGQFQRCSAAARRGFQQGQRYRNAAQQATDGEHQRVLNAIVLRHKTSDGWCNTAAEYLARSTGNRGSRVEGDSVITSRFIENITPPPFWANALRSNDLAGDAPCDRWQICRFTPPSHVMIEVGVAHAGHGGYNAPPELKAGSIVVDFITPESEPRSGTSGAWRATSSPRTPS